MKLNLFETHDRLEELKKRESDNMSRGIEECLKKNPLSLALQNHSHYIYIWAHPRTHENGYQKRMIYQPRLTKPLPQTNSYLFRVSSGSDLLEICWMIPPREVWPQYKKGNITESEIVIWSIDMFEKNRKYLTEPFQDDLPDDRIKQIYTMIKVEMDQDRRLKTMYAKQDSLGEYEVLYPGEDLESPLGKSPVLP